MLIFSNLRRISACFSLAGITFFAFAGPVFAFDSVAELLKLASAGDSRAMVSLGTSYKIGMGCEKDELKAYEWYRKAYEKGEPQATAALGNMYELGLGGLQKDCQKADSMYRDAAAQGDNSAMSYLGDLYLYGTCGHGVDRNAAKGWYRQAVDKGNFSAQRMLDLIAKAEAKAAQNPNEFAKFSNPPVSDSQEEHERRADQRQREAREAAANAEIERRNRENAAREERAPSIWEINAQKSAEALRDAEAHHRRVTDPNYGTGCNSSVYGCR